MSNDSAIDVVEIMKEIQNKADFVCLGETRVPRYNIQLSEISARRVQPVPTSKLKQLRRRCIDKLKKIARFLLRKSAVEKHSVQIDELYALVYALQEKNYDLANQLADARSLLESKEARLAALESNLETLSSQAK